MKIEKDDFDSKIANLDNRINDLHGFFKTHLTVISIILASAALILSYLSFTSKREVKEAIDDMENKFEMLSNQALKSPHLVLLYSEKPLEGTLINIPITNNRFFELKEIFIKNIGDGINTFVSYKLFFSKDITQRGAEWYGPHSSYSEKYDIYYSWGAMIPINPNDYWHITNFSGNITSLDSLKYECKLEVYYGSERPAEATFHIQFEKTK
jgi:hypothetical protein